jgi:hypothetical protein
LMHNETAVQAVDERVTPGPMKTKVHCECEFGSRRP